MFSLSYDVKSCLKRSGKFRMYVFTLEGLWALSQSKTHEPISFANIKFCFQKTFSYVAFVFNRSRTTIHRIQQRSNKIPSHYLNTFLLDQSRRSYKLVEVLKLVNSHLLFLTRLLSILYHGGKGRDVDPKPAIHAAPPKNQWQLESSG